jgi:hypothetical protein
LLATENYPLVKLNLMMAEKGNTSTNYKDLQDLILTKLVICPKLKHKTKLEY